MAQTTKPSSIFRRAAEELGLSTLVSSPRDVKILCAQRAVRLAGYGGTTLVLASHLAALGTSRTRTGLFMTLTLAGDVAISAVLAVAADGLGRRAVLAVGAALMAASGVVFATASGFWPLLLAAVLGVISPSGNEVGPFRAVEESALAHLVPSAAARPDVYAWYSLLGTAGSALGLAACGWLVELWRHRLGWEALAAYRGVFWVYAALGVVKLGLVLALSEDVEAEGWWLNSKKRRRSRKEGVGREPAAVYERIGLVGRRSGRDGEVGEGNGRRGEGEEEEERGGGGGGDGDGGRNEEEEWGGDEEEEEDVVQPVKRGRFRRFLPEISPESVQIMISLCILFAMDAFASGLAPLSWVTFFFRSRYDIEEGKLGTVFFTTSIIAACSMLVASSLAKRFGNVNTMVFTHLPSAIFLALIPIPNDVHLSLLFLILRSCSQSMDVAPRSAFLAAIVLPGERTAIMGLVNVVKTMAQSMGPLITGVLADRNLFWVSFVAAGSLKATYDLGLLAVFKNHEREKADRERVAEERRHKTLHERDGSSEESGN